MRMPTLAGVVLFVLSPASFAADFIPLGDLPGGEFRSSGSGVSADGSVVVGRGSSELGAEAYRWTATDGMIGLGDLPGGPFLSSASDTNSDGSVVVGRGRPGGVTPSGNDIVEAFRWTEEDGMIGLGHLPGRTESSRASAISADGSVVVGDSQSSTTAGPEAFRWTADEGMISLGHLEGFDDGTFARAVSADGSVVVGGTAWIDVPSDEAFRWTQATGMVGLGVLPGAPFGSSAWDVSADGSVVVGTSDNSFGAEAFRWTQEGGMQGLGGDSSHVRAVSADGSVILGFANFAAGREPFIWTADAGMRNLKDTLVTDFGLDLAGWTLSRASDISADGTVIVGSGYNPNGDSEAWMVRLDTATLNGRGESYTQDFNSLRTQTGSMPRGWTANDGSLRTIDSLGLVDGPLERLADSDPFLLNLGGSSEYFEGSAGHLATWQTGLVRDGVLNEADMIKDDAEDRALGIGRVDENDPGRLQFEIEIGDASLRAFTLDWDLEIWGGDPDAQARGSDGGGFAAEVTIGGETYYEATVSHKPGELFYTEYDGADTDRNTTLIDGNLHSVRGNHSDIVEVSAIDGAVGNKINLSFDANYGDHDKGWISAIDNVQLRALAPGDADANGIVDVADLLTLLGGQKFNQGVDGVTWAQGDFNADDQFNTGDLLAMLSFLSGTFPSDPYASEAGNTGDEMADVIVNSVTGEVTVDLAGHTVSAVIIESAAEIFNGAQPDWDTTSQFPSTLPGELGNVLFTSTASGVDELGAVISQEFLGRDKEFYLQDLDFNILIASEGGALTKGNVIVVPEPSTWALLVLGIIPIIAFVVRTRRQVAVATGESGYMLQTDKLTISPIHQPLNRSAVYLLVLLLSLTIRPGHAASFQGLGDLPGGEFRSAAWDVSADGSVVVGYSASSREAFRWTATEGMIGLGDLPGESFVSSIAFATNLDGTVVVGSSSVGPNEPISGTSREASIWTEEDGMIGLGYLPGRTRSSIARGISADGSVVVGYSESSTAAGSVYEAFRWTADEGMIGLGDLPGGPFRSSASAISADGSVIVGSSWTDTRSEAFRWTVETGMVGLGHLSGESWGNGVSADGSVIVGSSGSSLGREAFRWTQEGGMQGLGDLPGGDFNSGAGGVSADGSVVVGRGNSAAGGEPFIWTADGGLRNFKDTLVTDFGLDLGGWTLNYATGISNDGTVIVGTGDNPNGDTEAWMVRLDTATLNGRGESYTQNFDILGTQTGSMPQGWSANNGSLRTIDSLGLVDGPLERLADSDPFQLNLGGSSEHFEGSAGHVATWQRDVVRDLTLNDTDMIADAAEDRALGIGRVSEQLDGSLSFEIEIGEAPLRAFTLNWDLEIWGGDPDAQARGSDGGGFAAEVTIGGETYYEATVFHKPGELFYSEYDGADAKYNSTLIDGNIHSVRGNHSDIVEVNATDGAVGNKINLSFDADFGDHDKGWISAIDNVRLRALAPGDADANGVVDVADLLQLLGGQKFNQGVDGVTWEQGDFNADDEFNTGDLLAMLSFLSGTFPSDPYASEAGGAADSVADVIVNSVTGEITVDLAGHTASAILISSAAEIFNGSQPDWDTTSQFPSTLPGELGNVLFTSTASGVDELGAVISPEFLGRDKEFYLEDLDLNILIASEGGALTKGNVIVVPEPSTWMLLGLGSLTLLAVRLRRH